MAASRHEHSGFRPDIEGMRGIAVLLVVLFHCGVPGFQGGFIGVDVFFALSGYLITGIILKEITRTGKLSFRNFYARRVRRLLPAAGLVVVCTLLLGLVMYSPLELARYAKWATYTSLYSSNYMFMRDASNYFSSDVTMNPYLHTWSLAVEEQFYLFWPALIAVTLFVSKSRRRLAIVLAALSIVSMGLCLWLTRHRTPWAFFSLPTRAWEFALGGLACMVPVQTLQRLGRWNAALGWSGLAAVLAGAFAFSSQTAFPGIAALLPVAGTVATLIACASGERSALLGTLGTPTLQYLGRLSYSWYLWHWPILLMAELRFPEITWTGKLVAAAIALLLAQITFVLVEKPVRFHPFLMARPVTSLGLAVLVAALGVSAARFGEAWARHSLASGEQAHIWAAANDTRELFDAHCLTPGGSSRILQCEYGDKDSKNSVVLFGDSHAEHWFPALKLIATEKHWRLVTLLKSSCPVARVQVFSTAMKRMDTECPVWREAALSRIALIHPALVVISEKDGMVSDSSHPLRPHLIEAKDWQQGLRSTLSYLDERSLRTVVIADIPRATFDIPTCLSRAAANKLPDHACDVAKTTALNESARQAERTAVDYVHNARLLDFTDTLCPSDLCRTVIDGEVVFRDSNHLTSRFASILAPSLEHQIDGLWPDDSSPQARDLPTLQKRPG
jgi:peptidoglycan/LPS O-acetylase OafA/YrhL